MSKNHEKDKKNQKVQKKLIIEKQQRVKPWPDPPSEKESGEQGQQSNSGSNEGEQKSDE